MVDCDESSEIPPMSNATTSCDDQNFIKKNKWAVKFLEEATRKERENVREGKRKKKKKREREKEEEEKEKKKKKRGRRRKGKEEKRRRKEKRREKGEMRKEKEKSRNKTVGKWYPGWCTLVFEIIFDMCF
ncbi:hypothetical protein ACOSQ2_031965 [Xanthoceras sorbifolium]